MTELEDVRKELETIKERNLRVEGEKAWETSTFRVLSITATTYLIAGIVFFLIEVAHPWRNALIPTLGYFLSVQSLPFIKRNWIKRYTRNRKNSGE